jgi:HD-GYP domain-containing protein (c-di-GMP phosphodiesterase class II)
MWDKIMGILLLLSSEEKYDKYNSAKSRKKAFKKLSEDVTFIDPDYVESILTHLQKFDDSFRTP